MTIHESIHPDFAMQLQGSMSSSEWSNLSSSHIGGGLTGTVASALDQAGLFGGGLTSAVQVDNAITSRLEVAFDQSLTPIPMTSQDMLDPSGGLSRGVYTTQVVLPFDVVASLL
jgi:hypothetical protein